MNRLRLLTVLIGLVGSAYSSPIVSVAVIGSATVGGTFDVEVRALDFTNAYAFQFDLLFDPTLVAALSVSQGTLLGGSGGFFPGLIDNVQGSISFVLDSLTGLVPGVTGDGSLAIITFSGLAPGTTQLSLANVILLDSDLADVPFSSQNGSVTLNADTGVPEPSTLPAILVGWGALTALRYHRRRRVR